MIEILIFLVVMVLAFLSYKIGTGDWFFPDLEDTALGANAPVADQLHDDPATVATAATRLTP